MLHCGYIFIKDRHISGRKVLMDKTQDWLLLSSLQQDGYTIFKFTRPLELCSEEDRSIEVDIYFCILFLFQFNKKIFFLNLIRQRGSPYVIYAYGLTDPLSGQDIMYHDGRRGTKVVNIISSLLNDEALSIQDVETLEYSISHVCSFFLMLYLNFYFLKIYTKW